MEDIIITIQLAVMLCSTLVFLKYCFQLFSDAVIHILFLKIFQGNLLVHHLYFPMDLHCIIVL